MPSSLTAFASFLALLTRNGKALPGSMRRVDRRRTATGSSMTARNNLHPDGNLRFHELTVISSHNAHANRDEAGDFIETLGIHQDDSIYHQLDVNEVRHLLLDIAIDDGEFESLRLVHGFLDYGGFLSQMQKNIIRFLEDDEEAIVTLDFETVGEDAAPVLDALREAILALSVDGVPLKDMIFKYSSPTWKDHDDWPTLDEIRASGQRVFVLVDRSEMIDPDYGFMWKRQVTQENDWRGIEDCIPRHVIPWKQPNVSLPQNDYWSRLFFMNHFCCALGLDSLEKTVGDNLIGGGDNGWGVLYPRIEQCMADNGNVKPNFIALDWVVQGEEALEIADYLNFGGALGTGQACTDDTPCATSSCNLASGVCQCEECDADGDDVCAGCESDQFCFSPADDVLNECRVRASLPPNYCGAEFFETVRNCNGAVLCPDGDGCPSGFTCFANINCTPVPTPTPTDLQSDFPSNSPTGGPSTSPTLVPTVTPSSSPTVSPTVLNTQFCGTEYFVTKENCHRSTPCPGSYGQSVCDSLGLTCFANILCDITKNPTIPPKLSPTHDSDNVVPLPSTSVAPITLTPKSPSPVAPTKSPTSEPTKAPFDFSNQFYCGSNFTDARINCYLANPPCIDRVCTGKDQTCYSGIFCVLPPTETPTKTPTFTELPSLSSLLPPVPIPRPTTPPQDFGLKNSSASINNPLLTAKTYILGTIYFSAGLILGYF